MLTDWDCNGRRTYRRGPRTATWAVMLLGSAPGTVMRRRRGKGDQSATHEHWHDEGDVGAVARARIGVVVHDEVARPESLTARGHAPIDASPGTLDRARLQRSRLR